MLDQEYAVKLTVAGQLRAWEEAMSEYTRNLSTAEYALVVAAGAIRSIAVQEGAEGYATDASQEWWNDLETLPRGSRFTVLTRVARAGLDTPIRYQYTTDDGE